MRRSGADSCELPASNAFRAQFGAGAVRAAASTSLALEPLCAVTATRSGKDAGCANEFSRDGTPLFTTGTAGIDACGARAVGTA